MLTIKYFTASWCGPCKMFGPVFDQVMGETGTNFQKIDVDSNRELAMQYGVSSVPTIIFEVSNEIVHRQSGVMSRAQLITLINKFRQADPGL